MMAFLARPPLRAAAGVPAGVVAKHAEKIETGGLNTKAAGFDVKWLALKKAAMAKPFGDPAKPRKTCEGYERLVRRLPEGAIGNTTRQSPATPRPRPPVFARW